MMQMDYAHFGGKRGRGAGGKTSFVVVVQTYDQSHPHHLKPSAVMDFRKAEIET